MPSIEKAPALAGDRDQHSGQRRADQARHVHHRRVDGDGVLQVALVVHHLHHEGLAAGHIEGIDAALHHAQRQQQGMVMWPRERQRGQRQRLDHGEGLRPHQHLAAVEPVHPYAGEGRQQKGGNLPGKADRAQQQRRTGEPVDQPAGGHARHPRADERDGLPAEEEPEVAMAQRPPGVG